MIRPTALVDASVNVPSDCVIGVFSVIERGIRLGRRVRIGEHVVIKTGTVLGDDVEVHAGVVLGDDPQIVGQDFAFESGVVIGNRTVLREGVTVHRASKTGQQTRVGEDCLLMAYSHVGHDTVVGNHCILANLVLLAGCVTVEDYVFLSGGSMIHQFVHIGESAFISGNAEISMHIPPFVTALGRNTVSNLNLVGLQRRGFSPEELSDTKQQYRAVYGGDSRSFQKKALSALEKGEFKTERGRQFLEFFKHQTHDRGFAYPKKRGE